MRFLNSFLCSIAIGIISLYTILYGGELYVNYISGSKDLLFVFIISIYSALLIIPVCFLFLIIFYKQLNVKLMLYTAMLVIWLHHLIVQYSILNILSNVINLPILIFVIGYLLLRRVNFRSDIQIQIFGALLGLFLAYGLIIFDRWYNNSLVTYFSIGSDEQKLLLLFFILGIIISYLWSIRNRIKTAFS